MKISPRPNHHNIRVVNQEKLDEREAWHKIVVKILSWKDGLTEGSAVKFKDKITSIEWNIYWQSSIRINVIHGKEKTEKKLEEIRRMIQKHGGFEN